MSTKSTIVLFAVTIFSLTLAFTTLVDNKRLEERNKKLYELCHILSDSVNDFSMYLIDKQLEKHEQAVPLPVFPKQ